MQAENLENSPIVSVECDEPEGLVTRHVYPMKFTQKNLKQFWELARQHKTLFSSDIRNDLNAFTKLLLTEDKNGMTARGLFWVIDDFVGVFAVTEIKPCEDGRVHYTFFDGRHRGRVNLVKQMLKYGFETFGFHRLTCEIPTYAKKQAHNFAVDSLGFRKEGVKKQAILFDDKWFDVVIYGLLAERYKWV